LSGDGALRRFLEEDYEDGEKTATELPESLTEIWKAFRSMAPDWSKLFAEPKVPLDAWSDVLQANRQNVEALARLSESAASSMKKIADSQFALFQSMMAETEKAAGALRASGE
jgi:hypothetical protein